MLSDGFKIYKTNIPKKKQTTRCLSSLTETRWHVSIKVRISPRLGEVGVPIFHQPSKGWYCWATRKKRCPSLPLERFTLSDFTRWRNAAAPLRPAARGTSSTGKTEPCSCARFLKGSAKCRSSGPLNALPLSATWDFFFFLAGLNAAFPCKVNGKSCVEK